MEIGLIAKKELQTPTHGDCGVVDWLIFDVISKEFFSWLPKVPWLSVLPWKKYNCVFNEAKANAQSFCFIVLQILHNLPRVPVASRAEWSVLLAWEHTVQRVRLQITEQGRMSFFHLELCTLRLGRNQKLLQNNQSASQTVCVVEGERGSGEGEGSLHWLHPPANVFFPG